MEESIPRIQDESEISNEIPQESEKVDSNPELPPVETSLTEHSSIQSTVNGKRFSRFEYDLLLVRTQRKN